MRHRGIRAVAALVLTAGLVFADIGVASIASAHQFEDVATISLQRKPRTVPRGGGRVNFFGRVKAEHRKCRAHRLVKIFRIHSGLVTTALTRGGGAYSVTKNVRPGRYVARVASFAAGEHPHRHVCFGARSPVRRIRRR